MKKFVVLLVLLVGMFLASAVIADTISGSGSWQSWTADNNGYEYWDNASSDGTYQNVGYILQSLGLSGSTDLYYGGSTDITFISSGTSQAAITVEIAGWANSNVFGYYTIDEYGNIQLHQLFSGNDTTGASITFYLASGTVYGFYFTTNDGTYYTQASNNTSDVDVEHFAIFEQGSSTYYLGMEDTTGGDYDYNDMVVKITQVAVPEPACLVLLGFGLLGLAGVTRKYQK